MIEIRRHPMADRAAQVLAPNRSERRVRFIFFLRSDLFGGRFCERCDLFLGRFGCDLVFVF